MRTNARLLANKFELEFSRDSVLLCQVLERKRIYCLGLNDVYIELYFLLSYSYLLERHRRRPNCNKERSLVFVRIWSTVYTCPLVPYDVSTEFGFAAVI